LGALEHLRLGLLQDAIQAPQDGERQDDLAVVGLLVVAAKQVGDRPDESGVVVDRRLGHAAVSSYPS
jgi:hypothetical protein